VPGLLIEQQNFSDRFLTEGSLHFSPGRVEITHKRSCTSYFLVLYLLNQIDYDLDNVAGYPLLYYRNVGIIKDTWIPKKGYYGMVDCNLLDIIG